MFGMIAALVLMTGAFTGLSAGNTEGAAIDAFVLVNGDEVVESDFVTRLATVEQNLMMLSAETENAGEGRSLAESLLDIMQSTPAETIALASLILDKAIYQEAIERGHMPDQELIAQQVEQERSMFEMIEASPEQYGVNEADVQNYRDNIEEIGGDDLYWNEFYPQIMEQQMAVQQFQMTASQEGQDWIVIQRQAFDSAEVRVGDPDAIAPATVSAAGDYLTDVWDLYQDQG